VKRGCGNPEIEAVIGKLRILEAVVDDVQPFARRRHAQDRGKPLVRLDGKKRRRSRRQQRPRCKPCSRPNLESARTGAETAALAEEQEDALRILRPRAVVVRRVVAKRMAPFD
jgi:hypothetical protein